MFTHACKIFHCIARASRFSNLLHTNLYRVSKPDPTNAPQLKHRSKPAHFSGACCLSLSIDYLQMAAWHKEQRRISLEMGVELPVLLHPMSRVT